MNYMWFWLVFFVILLICELITSSLISIWFCGGALAALLTEILGLNFLVQLTVFIAVSSVLLFLTRPIAKKVLKKEPLKTNVSTLIGKKAVVTKQINNSKAEGEIIVDGQFWSAKASEDKTIEPSSNVIIEEIQGVKAVVKSIKD
ncbi:MAG: NfeD family protein [Clostridiales bacterium]|nr:NfeD family protein [Clostridiales bacterium]